MTPKIIWQTWKSKKQDEIPFKLYWYSKSWKNLKDYKYFLLDDNDLRNVILDLPKEYSSKYINIYDSFTHNIERVDFSRYALLYLYGGVYADMDTVVLRDIDTWVNMNKIILGCEPKEHAVKLYNRERVLCNALMISPPKEKFWLKLMDYIIENYEHNYKPVETTGPMAITKFLDNNKTEESSIVITNPCVFYPLKSNGLSSKECDMKESYVAHIWENTWVKPWYEDKAWMNKRYWKYFCLVLVSITIFYCLKVIINKTKQE